MRFIPKNMRFIPKNVDFISILAFPFFYILVLNCIPHHNIHPYLQTHLRYRREPTLNSCIYSNDICRIFLCTCAILSLGFNCNLILNYNTYINDLFIICPYLNLLCRLCISATSKNHPQI